MNIFIAIPMLDGKIFDTCHESLLRNTHYLRDKGHKVFPYHHPGNIYIDQARNICVHEFLQTDCSDMIFIDADLSFDDSAIEKLIQQDLDIVAGVYPFKNETGEYPGTLEFDEETQNCLDDETGLVRALMAPTGFMRINRRVFERMIEHAPAGNTYPIQKDSRGVWNFFVTGMVFPDDDTWYGEDVAFCHQWRRMGGKIFIVPDITFVHTGVKQFHGNYHQYLMGRSVDMEEAQNV